MKSQLGLTLVELMIVLAISSLVLSFAIPCYQNLIGRNRLRVAADQLLHGIAIAKQQALLQEERVLFCSVAAHWQGGQQVVRERDHQVLAVLPALGNGVNVIWRGNLGQSDNLRFDGSGLPDGQWGSFWLQTKGYNGSWRLVMNAVGGTYTQPINNLFEPANPGRITVCP